MSDEAAAAPDVGKAIAALGRRMEELRAAFLFQALGPERVHDIVAFDTPVRFHLPQGASDHIQRHILLTSTFFEMHQLGLIRTRLPPGAVVVDAGANIGNHTLFFAKICRASAVIAFEPQRNVFATLQRNLALNDATNVTAVNAALGAQPGEAALAQAKPGNLGATSFDLGTAGGYPVTTIDALGLDRLDFLKIDVEGNHLALLEGARETLARHRPTIWIELRPHQGELEAGEAALETLGYRRAATIARNDHLYRPA